MILSGDSSKKVEESAPKVEVNLTEQLSSLYWKFNGYDLVRMDKLPESHDQFAVPTKIITPEGLFEWKPKKSEYVLNKTKGQLSSDPSLSQYLSADKTGPKLLLIDKSALPDETLRSLACDGVFYNYINASKKDEITLSPFEREHLNLCQETFKQLKQALEKVEEAKKAPLMSWSQKTKIAHTMELLEKIPALLDSLDKLIKLKPHLPNVNVTPEDIRAVQLYKGTLENLNSHIVEHIKNLDAILANKLPSAIMYAVRGTESYKKIAEVCNPETISTNLSEVETWLEKREEEAKKAAEKLDKLGEDDSALLVEHAERSSEAIVYEGDADFDLAPNSTRETVYYDAMGETIYGPTTIPALAPTVANESLHDLKNQQKVLETNLSSEELAHRKLLNEIQNTQAQIDGLREQNAALENQKNSDQERIQEHQSRLDGVQDSLASEEKDLQELSDKAEVLTKTMLKLAGMVSDADQDVDEDFNHQKNEIQESLVKNKQRQSEKLARIGLIVETQRKEKGSIDRIKAAQSDSVSEQTENASQLEQLETQLRET